MRDPSGVSKGSGFVAFSTPEEASRAVSSFTPFNAAGKSLMDMGKAEVLTFDFLSLQLSEMNGKMIVSKPLYVALAQRKEERRARLQVFYSYFCGIKQLKMCI